MSPEMDDIEVGDVEREVVLSQVDTDDLRTAPCLLYCPAPAPAPAPAVAIARKEAPRGEALTAPVMRGCNRMSAALGRDRGSGCIMAW